MIPLHLDQHIGLSCLPKPNLLGALEHEFYDFPDIGNNQPS
jgi:hypothetical protein